MICETVVTGKGMIRLGHLHVLDKANVKILSKSFELCQMTLPQCR